MPSFKHKIAIITHGTVTLMSYISAMMVANSDISFPFLSLISQLLDFQNLQTFNLDKEEEMKDSVHVCKFDFATELFIDSFHPHFHVYRQSSLKAHT